MDFSSPRMALGVGLGVAVTGTVLWAWRSSSRPHEAWVEVGKVEDLMLFPLKSARGARVEQGTVHPFGFVSGGAIDRSFIIMMTSASPWIHVTNGMVPPLCLITPTILEGRLTLTTPSGESIEVNIEELLQTGKPTEFVLKGDPVSGWDCGVAVAQWLQDLLYSAQPKDKRPTLKLMFVGNPQEMKRPANKPDFFDFPQFKAKDLMLFQDSTAILLTSSSSLKDLNSKLKDKVDMMQVRPNIVVSGGQAFEEDNWAYLRIGDHLRLRTLKPREACHRIMVRPDNAEKHTEMLDVLKQYRVPPMPKELAQKWSKAPFFGLNMALDSEPAEVKIGDPVWAIKRKPNWLL